MSGVAKGQPWGASAPVPAGIAVAGTDAEVRRVVEDAARAGETAPPVLLIGGDLHRTLGGIARHRDEPPPPVATRCEIDVGAALVDGRLHRFVAHLVVRRAWWRGEAHVAMNAEHLRSWDVAPRAHPGDGIVDVLDARLRVADRWKVRARLRSGTHLPHPDLVMRRESAYHRDWPSPRRIWLDGEPIGHVRTLSVRVEPASLVVFV